MKDGAEANAEDSVANLNGLRSHRPSRRPPTPTNLPVRHHFHCPQPIHLTDVPQKYEDESIRGNTAFGQRLIHKSLVASDISPRDSFHSPDDLPQTHHKPGHLKRIYSSGDFLGRQTQECPNNLCFHRCCAVFQKSIIRSPKASESNCPKPTPSSSPYDQSANPNPNSKPNLNLIVQTAPRAEGDCVRESHDTNCTGESQSIRKDTIVRSQFRSKSVSTASHVCTPRRLLATRTLIDHELLEGSVYLPNDSLQLGKVHKSSFELDNVLSDEDNKINFGDSFMFSQSVPGDGFLEEDHRHVETIVFRKKEEEEDREMSGPMYVVASGFTAIAVTGFFIAKGLRSVFG